MLSSKYLTLWSNIKRVFLGFFLSCILSCILAGGTDGLVIIGVAVVCTAGIGLVALIPLWWFMGTAALLVVRLLMRQTADSRDQDVATDASVSAADVALMQWITAARGRGETTESITRYLLDMGWNAEQIRTARSRTEAQPAKS